MTFWRSARSFPGPPTGWCPSTPERSRTRPEYTAGVTIVAALMLTVIVPLSRQSLGQVESGDWLWIGLLAVVPGQLTC